MTKRIRKVVEYKRRCVKKVTKSSILINNHQLDSIEVNKGQIHIELRYFQRTLRNSLKSDNELRREIMDFSIFGKRTRSQIQGVKNHSIWIKIRREIKEQKLDRKSITKRKKSEIKSKINLMYNYKLQSNDT